MPAGSSPMVGSSSTNNSGSGSNAAAIPSRCFIPSEYVDARSLSRPVNPTMSKHLVDPRLWEPTQRRQAAQVVARRQAANERRVLDQRADTPSESLRLPNRHTEHGAISGAAA